MPLQQGQ